jgi:hypothetical protein
MALAEFMNCFAHAYPFLEDPYFIVGACLPDWMAVINRKVRFRSHRIAPWIESTDPRIRSLFSGVQQHLNDDHWFHGTSIFVELNLKLSKRLAYFESGISSLQSNFVAHIAIEMLIDDELSNRHPGQLEYYYEQLNVVDAAWLQNQLEQFAVDREVAYARFHERFLEARFLFDYASNDGMLYRLNQVMRRAQLSPLSSRTVEWIPEVRVAVRDHFLDLLHAYPFNVSG